MKSEPAEEAALQRRLSAIPSIDLLLSREAIAEQLAHFARGYVVDALREASEALRKRLRSGRGGEADAAAEIERCALDSLRSVELPAPPRVVNATGTVLHTNLGRALLPEAAIAAIVSAARHPVALEFDLRTGGRGDRDDTVIADLLALTGAEAATVVNNNAAAVLLALSAVAEGREVVVSRGELIEIGGSFRMPDVTARSGARLVEVGTTNRTHPDDYRRAIGAETAALLKVHTSNYEVVGFTAEVELDQLVAIARDHSGLRVIEDLGAGALVDLSRYGLPREPIVAERVAAGADIVSFSGDKLLGGPQAGILVGKADAIAACKRHPLRRALRPDKLTLAALAAVLRIYRRSPALELELPALRWLTRSVEELEASGARIAEGLRARLGASARVSVVESEAQIGSGAQPTARVPSRALAVEVAGQSADAVAADFRAESPPVIGRIHDGRFLLDLRGLCDVEELFAPPADRDPS